MMNIIAIKRIHFSIKTNLFLTVSILFLSLLPLFGGTIPPGQVTGVAGTTGLQVTLSWIAPGDDGYTGNVSSGTWEIRGSSNPAATPDCAEFIMITSSFSYTQGTTYQQLITGLVGGASYNFWVRAKDDSTNWSAWSAGASVQAGGFIDINAGLIGIKEGFVTWVDFDNDGDYDIAMTGNTDSGITSKIYRNNHGEFTDINAGIIQLFVSYLAWGDYDNDGDLDLALVGGGAGVSRMYRNHNGVFNVGAEFPVLASCSIAWGDYDNDGDLDLAMAGMISNNTYITRIYDNNDGV